MLRVAKVRPGGHSYYLEVVDSGVEAPGEWLSAGAAIHDLRGVVSRDDLEAVLAGSDPSTGRRLGKAHDRVKVAGFDMTFCAPKSVSIMHALGDADVSREVRRGHAVAVSEALSYVERRALAVRRAPGHVLLQAEGVAAGGFMHRTSRSLDPHLHTHVVVANLARGSDGTWSALDGRGVYAHIATAGALYHAQLRHELTGRLGVGWEPLNRGRADIAGIGREVRREFSQRSREIEADLAERGLVSDRKGASPRAREVAALATRAERDPHLAPETLRGSWEERARDVGLSPRHLEAALDRVPSQLRGHSGPDLDHDGTPGASPGAGGAVRSVDDALGRFERRSITRRDVTRAWCSVLDRGAPVEAVERAADAYLSSLEPVEGWAGARDAPGVGERRHVIEGRAIQREATDERRRMDRHLAARGMSRAGEDSLGLGRDAGLDLGW